MTLTILADVAATDTDTFCVNELHDYFKPTQYVVCIMLPHAH